MGAGYTISNNKVCFFLKYLVHASLYEKLKMQNLNCNFVQFYFFQRKE